MRSTSEVVRRWNLSIFACALSLPLVLVACGGGESEAPRAPESSEGSSGGDWADDAETFTSSSNPAPSDDGAWGDELDDPEPASRDDEAGDPSGSESTATDEGPADGADAAATEPDPEPEADANPWGATREEQCRRPERATMSASAQASIRRGIAAARAGNSSDAMSAFQQALAADRGAYAAAYNLGVLADRAGNSGQAREFYRQALQILPDYEDAARGMVALHLRANSISDAVAFVQPLARRFATNLAMQALYAEVLTAAERYEEAWQAARQALRCDERYVPALVALVKASLAQGRGELAERVLDQAMEIDADNAELHFIKAGLVVEEPGRLGEALTLYRRAVELRPAYAEARMALGIRLLAGANYAEALTQFQQVALLTPNEPAVHLNVGDAHRALRQWEEAQRAFDRALRADPNMAAVHYNLALMFMTAEGDYPGLDRLSAMQRAVQEFTRYRDMMGPRLARDDPSEGHLQRLDRLIRREQRRQESEAAERQREAERAARGEDAGEEGFDDEGFDE